MIKCHFCKHELERPYDYENNAPEDWWECPNGHASVKFNKDEKEIIQYTLYWDADPNAQERYKLVGVQGLGTALHYSNIKSRWRSYKMIFETGSFITVPVREETLQMDNLVTRLKKMGVFS